MVAPNIVLSLDTETALLRPGLQAPPLVCLTWQSPGSAAGICHVTEAEPRLRAWLADPSIVFVGHNIAYDFAVISEEFPSLRDAIFEAYDVDRVTDTGIRQKLLDNAEGGLGGKLGAKGAWVKRGYSLEELANRIAGVRVVKEGFRLFYSFFRETPLSAWEARALELQERGRKYKAGGHDAALDQMRGIIGDDAKFFAELDGMVVADPSRVSSYPVDDASATLAIFLKQEAHASYLADQFRQTRAACWLHYSSVWGLRTDAPGVEHLRQESQAAYDEVFARLVEAKIVRANGTRDTKAAAARMVAVCKAEGLPLRRTASHTDACDPTADCHICLDSDACEASGDPLLEDYAELSTLTKVLRNDVEALSKGIAYPVHTRYGFAATGRTTSSGPNIQNLRRKAGIREAFVPRPGKVFAAADYPQLELYTLAQCCVSWLGESKLADALNAGLDPHLAMAAQIVGCTYDAAKENIDTPEVDNARQTAKVANFGFPGGLGIKKLCLFAKKTYRVDLTETAAKKLKEQWYATWPEMPHYFARVNALCDTPDGRASVETLFTKRIRGGASYCAACNNGFQALGSDCAKNAGWLIAKSVYTNRASALFNSRVVAFVHDEFIVETEDGPGAHDAAFELARLMCDGANEYLRDVPVTLSQMKPLLMRRWSKKAKQILDKEGRLVAWQ